ncbi:hypothetical protein E4U54_001757 [Claviceps lovelessii]|nr:hypothetical protein E4U54_001757 [Claviceps lovelessii]
MPAASLLLHQRILRLPAHLGITSEKERRRFSTWPIKADTVEEEEAAAAAAVAAGGVLHSVRTLVRRRSVLLVEDMAKITLDSNTAPDNLTTNTMTDIIMTHKLVRTKVMGRTTIEINMDLVLAREGVRSRPTHEEEEVAEVVEEAEGGKMEGEVQETMEGEVDEAKQGEEEGATEEEEAICHVLVLPMAAVQDLILHEAWVQGLVRVYRREELLPACEVEVDRNIILLLNMVSYWQNDDDGFANTRVFEPIFSSGRRPPPNQPDSTYGGYDQDQQLAGQMSSMDLNAQRPRRPDEYGRPMTAGGRAQHAGYGEMHQDMRAGPAGPAAPGNYAAYDPRHNGPQSPTSNDSGYPGRSMTVSLKNPGAGHGMAPPQRRGDTAPFNGAGDMGGNSIPPPPRPATAGSHRPPPQRTYPQSPPAVPQGYYGGGGGGGPAGAAGGVGNHYEPGYGIPPGPPGPGPGPTSQAYAPFGEQPYDSYYGSSQMSGGSDQQSSVYDAHSGQSTFADYDSSATSADHGRPSYDQAFRAPPRQPPHGAHGVPRLHHAKSEANFHQPQAAVFEMAADIPSVPPVPTIPQMSPYQLEFSHGYGEAPPPSGYDQLPPRGPSAPPGAMYDARRGFEANPSMSRHNPNPSLTPGPGSGPDIHPAHPTPIRPGLMPTAIINMNDRPPPVRNYSAMSQQPQAQVQQQYGQTRPPPPQLQQQQQQYQEQQYQQHHQQYQEQQYQQPPPAQSGPSYPPPPVEAEQIEEPVSAHQLERLRMAIKANASDQGSALKLAKKLIEAAEILAPRLPDPKQRTKARDRYLQDAQKVLKKLAIAENEEAMYVLADSLGKGLFGHEPDTKEAFTLYQSAAKLGHAQAAYRTAVCCEIGHEEGGGTRKDPLKAMQWYKRAATLGDPPAMYKVGMILLKGLLGQPRNPREAVDWLQRAAEKADKENPHSLHELGLLYESAQPSDAIVRDELYAFGLFQQAATLGYKFSQFRLGLAYELGQLGVDKDERQSIYWYSQAAQQEEHQSELALSGWYLTGSPGILNQSDTEAYLWARKAAVSGLAKAEYAMGYFTEMGIGVAPNLEDAKRWYWRAAAQDLPKARECLEDLKRVGKNGQPRPRERITRSRIERRHEGECSIM